MADSPWILETTPETFDRDVIERSRQAPVVVDFWAAWCYPCRMLGPILEKLALESDGRFVLVKADVEQMPEIASSFGVQGIPAVFGVRDARIVDSFVGVLPEPQLRAWLDGLQPSPAEILVREATALQSRDPQAAIARYREALTHAPEDPGVKIALARLLLAQGQSAECRKLIDELADRGFLEPEAEQLQAELALKDAAGGVGKIEQVRSELAAAPQDKSLKFQLAEALIGAAQYQEALDLCLELVQADRHGVGEQARQLMINVFNALGAESELVRTYQRKLSTALY
jgi:putative thioredoxin